jgi:hypothetical protein
VAIVGLQRIVGLGLSLCALACSGEGSDSSVNPPPTFDDTPAATGPVPYSITFDYRLDTSGWFADEVRRRALEAAGRLWSNHVATELVATRPGVTVYIDDLEALDGSTLELKLEEPLSSLLIFVACSPVLDEVGAAGRTRGGTTSSGGSPEGYASSPQVVGLIFACEESFFFDETPETTDDIPFSDVDFISMAAHELGHALGIGGIDAFFALVKQADGIATFHGEAAMAANGGPVLLDQGVRHVSSNVRSDGKEVLMDRSMGRGVAVRPTPLDLAILKDIGYQLR